MDQAGSLIWVLALALALTKKLLVITILQDKPIHIVLAVLTRRTLDDKHTVFGHVTNGMDAVNAITGGDKIEKIEVLDSTDDLFAAEKKRIDEWNAVLDHK